ncbi:uncharacterized protein BCR38DRAFT_206002 [Pseudomassariella vexata]|uniref:IPT/TIG domain-containing protein n=1 Tax=Pseudomassariella vexata TaxID=1141098 RepID=A0A1Y2DXN7_9PEZI|nr:uncharacterized protein BCR38DRAFT_206002 [Pseudomassariella vexata]ORY64068.1 hypothetical protein BCR38DRAFT_206002 [Pseudomassariella vexata]
MPTSGYSFGGTYESDSGMPVFGSNEFILDSDENFNSDTLFGLDSESLDPVAFGDSKTLLSSPSHQSQAASAAPGFSPPSHRDSSSSGSSRRSADSISPKTSHTSGDVMMTDEVTLGEWKGMDGLPKGEDNYPMFDDSVDNMVAHSHFRENAFFDFESASSSPNAPVPDGASSLSPENSTDTPMQLPAVRGIKEARGHNKAQSVCAPILSLFLILTAKQQHSLAQSMSGLHTNGSRETSPSMYPSQESSPAALFKLSPSGAPSPDNTASFMNGASTPGGFGGNAIWPNMGGFHVQPQPGAQPRPEPTNGAHMPPSYSSQRTPFNGTQPTLVIERTPFKSRVETQIPIKMTMYNLPQGIKRLHLPSYTISKAKLLARQAADRERSPDMWELYTMLVCTSAMQDEEKRKKAFARAAVAGHPTSADVDQADNEDNKPQNGGEVRICPGCILRERKRAGRKKNKKPEEEELWDRYQKHRAIVFNTNEVKDWQPAPDNSVPGITNRIPPGTVQIDAPMRIACYCRHHSEKLGFQVIFTIKDHQDRVIVQQISSSIMITDDHKTHQISTTPTLATNNSDHSAVGPTTEMAIDTRPHEAPLVLRQSQSTSDLQGLQQASAQSFQPHISNGTNGNSSQGTSVTATPRNLSRQASPTSPAGPVSKKRKAGNSSSKVPSGLTMTRLETTQPCNVAPPNSQCESAVVSAATSPFTPNMSFSGAPNSLYPQGHQPGLNTMQQSFATGPPTPNSNNDQMLFASSVNRNISMDNLGATHPLYSAPVSAHPSRAPSPNHLRNEVNGFQNSQLGQSMFTGPMGLTSARAPSPMIHKIIPGEGPKSGGIEVTILGSGFTNGGLEVMFGEQRATTTTFWGESSLVCLLPPSPVSGPVLVSIKQPRMQEQQPSFSNKHQALFRYVDDDEDQLIRTALVVLGHKVGGNIQDVADIARSIIGRSGQGAWGPQPGSAGQPTGGYSFDLGPASLEMGLLRVLELIDLDDSVNKARINLKRSTGQTMLHLACVLGLNRFVAGLLSRAANAGARDKGGFTPLHFAAMNDHSHIVRRLMISGADPTMRSLSGLTPADMARSRDVLRALRRVESHARSRSTSSLHSRVSSATSLRSLWDPPTMTACSQNYLSDASDSEEALGYSSSDDDNEEIDDGDWLDMRRPSVPRSHQLPDIVSPPTTDVPTGLASPSAAMTAFREQFATQLHQFQQSMAMISQNWPQFQMPMLPDYHNYLPLHNAPVMQRIASLVPNISGSRPGSAGDQPPRDADKQWWEMPSFFGAKDAPPPAYEDIFPQKDIDTKQASAATAAAEYEADAKCATLYDQTTAESSKVREIPALLQIGRKNAITKEQQENLQRAHAERLKTGSSDKMLWFVWIPLLTFILGAMMFSGAPTFASGVQSFVKFIAAPSEFLRQNLLETA